MKFWIVKADSIGGNPYDRSCAMSSQLTEVHYGLDTRTMLAMQLDYLICEDPRTNYIVEEAVFSSNSREQWPRD